MKLENICRKDVRFATRVTLDFRCIPQFHPKKNTGVSLVPTIIVEEVLEFHIRKDNCYEYRYPEGSISLTVLEAYQYLTYKHSQLPKNTAVRCQENCPYFNPKRHFLARRAKKAT
jgi:hypothetical protein